jgi:hypothetical protein
MVVFVLPKWAMFNEITRHSKLYQELPAMTQLLTRYSLDNPTQEEMAAPAPWRVQLSLGIDIIVVISQAHFDAISDTFRIRGLRNHHEIRQYSRGDIIDP